MPGCGRNSTRRQEPRRNEHPVYRLGCDWARESRRGLQSRARERSEAAGRTVRVCGGGPLRAIVPPSPILPCEVANLACFCAPPLVRWFIERAERSAEMSAPRTELVVTVGGVEQGRF